MPKLFLEESASPHAAPAGKFQDPGGSLRQDQEKQNPRGKRSGKGPRPTDGVGCAAATEIVARLTEEVRRIEGVHRQTTDAETVGTGCAAVDRLLPGRGLRRGTLVEWLAADPASDGTGYGHRAASGVRSNEGGAGSGAGATTLALIAGREACRGGGLLAVLDYERTFYPPAAAALGIDLARLVVVRPRHRSDEAWTLDQMLRSRALGAVLAWPGNWQETVYRRLQLAAEAGAALGLLVRPAAVAGEPCWAELRWRIEPRPSPARRRWRLEVLRIRGGQTGLKTAGMEVELDETTGALHETTPHESRSAPALPVAAALAAGTFRHRSRGA